MKITKISIKKTNWEDPKVLAIASVVIDDAIIINNIRIIQGSNKMFLAMPSIKTSWGFEDVVHPISQKTRNELEAAIFAEYWQL